MDETAVTLNFDGERLSVNSGCNQYFAAVTDANKFTYAHYTERGVVQSELYDLEKDPHQFDNLAYRPEYADALAELRSQLVSFLIYDILE